MLPWIQQFVRNKKTTKFFIGFLAVVFLFLGSTAHAQRVENQVDNTDVFGTAPVESGLILGGDDIRVTIVKIIRAALSLTGIVLLGIIIYAGFLWMTSGGSEDKIGEAKRIITNAVIGLAIILSAFAIVQFVLRALNQATRGVPGGGGGGGAPVFANFEGSGALGRIIEDHYPFIEETGVKRNVRVVVTFAEPINPSTLIQNTNNSCWTDNGEATTTAAICDPDGDGTLNRPEYLGDCVTPADINDFDFATDCDRMTTSSVQIFKQVAPDALAEASAFTTYEDGNSKNAYTFVFRPIELLGDGVQTVTTTVTLTSDIQKKNGEPAFQNERVNGNVRVSGAGDKYYTWNFYVDTTRDISAPFVTAISPNENESIARNTILQITFSEPVDPSVVQGLSGPNTPFYNILFGDQNITGEWKLTNSYRTVEFISDISCGQNSCGDTMYCLPVAGCNVNDANCSVPYEILLATAEKLPGNTFEARPFTGVNDMAGNALDGRSGGVFDHDNIPQVKPNRGFLKTIENNERAADNVWYSFRVRNAIDDRIPYIEAVAPAIDSEDVEGGTPLTAEFSQGMWYKTFSDIGLEEYYGTLPAGQDVPSEVQNLRPPWKRARAEDNNSKTTLTLDHRDFGPNNLDLYYFPSVPSTVKGNNQNCLYPGRGPIYDLANVGGAIPRCAVVRNADGSVQLNGNCTPPIPVTNDTDTGCALFRGAAPADRAQTSTLHCLNRLETLSPHP